jgi:hypothetical protein
MGGVVTVRWEAGPGVDPVAALAAVGSEFHVLDGDDLAESALAAILAEDERQVRAVIIAEPPAAGEENTGMGAWHVNAQHEAHVVRSGRGVLQVMTADGIVTVWLEPGTAMLMRGAEHRYRPLTAQEWVIRHSGGAEADLGAQETGREASAWPSGHPR